MPDTFPQLIVETSFDGDAGAPYRDAILATFPSVYYRLGEAVVLDGNLTDSSGNARTAALTGSVTFAQTGMLAGDPSTSALFAAGAYATSTFTPSALQDASFAIEAWLKAATLPGSNAMILGSSPGPRLMVTPGGFAYGAFESGGVTYAVAGTINVCDNTPHLLGVTFDGATLRVFTDGVLCASLGAAVAPAAAATPLYLGGAPGGPAWAKTIQDASYSQYVALPSEISYHYESRLVKITPTWTDLSSRVRHFSCERGERYETQTTETGTGNIIYKNDDRALEPKFSGSPYYPNVIPMRETRARALFNGVYYPLCRLYVERWPERWITPEYAETTVQLVDGLDTLVNDSGVTLFTPAEAVGLRISRVLQALGIPANRRSIQVGTSVIMGLILQSQNAMEHIAAVAETEDGEFFVSADGTYTFRDRHTRLLNAATSQAIFGDALAVTGTAGSELAYTDLVPDFDTSRLFNDIRVTQQGGPERIAQDARSIRQSRRRTKKITSLDVDPATCADLALYKLRQYKDADIRFESMTLFAGDGTDPNLIVQMLSRELGDRITVRRRPDPANPSLMIQKDCLITKITHAFDASHKTMTTVWQLNPADETTYWQLDSATLSILDTSTALSF